MLGIPFERLRLKGQWRSVPIDREVTAIGFDTETKDGLAKLICTRSLICHPASFDDCMTFLTRNAFRSKTLCFYNIKYDVQAILKWLPPDFWRELHETNVTKYYNYTLKWIPGKFFKIQKKVSKKSRSFMFFDCSQFYKRGNAKTTLADAALRHLNRTKLDPDVDIANMTDADFQRKDVIEYCMNDAALCEDLMNAFIATCHRGGMYPTNFASPASISTRHFSTHVNIPTINSLIKRHPECLRIAWKATNGAFICCFKRGYFPHVYEYDVNSQYPFAMSNLPDLTKGQFLIKKGGPPEGAFMGWMECRIDQDSWSKTFYHPPVCIKRKDNINYFPVGEYKTFLTLNEYRAYADDFNIDIVGGLYWLPESDPEYLYRGVIRDLYRIRRATKDESLKYFYKIALNGFYGKSLEKHYDRDPGSKYMGLFHTGNFFNPFYASYILADSRIMVYRALSALKPESIIACFTDSVLTTEPLKGVPFGDDMGQWGFVQSGDLVMIGCGVYTLRDKGRDTVKTKLRGFSTTAKTNLFDEIKRFHRDQEIALSVRINFSMALALMQDRPADMNKLIDTERITNVNFDTKRNWLGGHFRTCGDLLDKQLDSTPFFHGMFWQ